MSPGSGIRSLLLLTLLANLSACGSSADGALAPAREALKSGDAARAQALLEQAIQKNPGSAEARDLLGLTLQRLGSGDPESSFREAVRREPGNPEFHDHLAAFLYQKGSLGPALEEWKEAARVGPGYAPGRYNYGSALQAAGRPAEAEAELKEAVRLQPDFSSARVNLGIALVALGRLPEAEKELQEAARLFPKDPEVAFNLGVVYVTERKEEAIRELQRALSLRPDFAEAHERLATAYFFSGKLPEAQREFEAALRLKPDLADAHFGLGVLLSEEGKEEEAIREYEKTLAIQPEHPGATTNLALLYGRIGFPLDRPRNRVAAFEIFRRALLNRNYQAAWDVLSARSREIYLDDPERFRYAATRGWEDPLARERLSKPGYFLKYLDPPHPNLASGLPFDPGRLGALPEGPAGEWRVDLLVVHALPAPDPLR